MPALAHDRLQGTTSGGCDADSLSTPLCRMTSVRINESPHRLSDVLATVGAMGHLRGCARVSTPEPNADLQADELTAAGCVRLCVDHASGLLDDRPQLNR